MTILVQNCLNHLYLRTLSEWTNDPSDAKTFPSSENAMEYCSQHHLPAVQIILKFKPNRFNVTVPITAECEQAARSQKALLN